VAPNHQTGFVGIAPEICCPVSIYRQIVRPFATDGNSKENPFSEEFHIPVPEDLFSARMKQRPFQRPEEKMIAGRRRGRFV